MRRSFLLLLFSSFILHPSSFLVRADDSDSLGADENRLKSAFQTTDNAGLITFLRLRARGQPGAAKLGDLVDALDSRDMAERQTACAQLVAVGSPAVPLLRKAAREADAPERAGLARRCLTAIETDNGTMTAAVARLLAHHRVAGTADVLLEYLPHSENESVMEEVKAALAGVAYDKGKADPSVLKALSDEHPVRRAAAIQALCRGGSAEPRETLRKLLNDPMPSVRLQASLALAAAADAKAVSTLITLLGELNGEPLREVEGFLTELAGDLAPREALGNDEASRLKARDAWARWWLGTEGGALLEELRKRTLKEVDRDRTLALIEKLGDDSFEARQQAEKDLTALGAPIIPLLKQAGRHSDLEVRNRSAKCLLLIEKERPAALSPVTARLIALRKPAGAAEAILAFLPFAEDDSIVEELQGALNVVAFSAGKPDPALVKALEDKVAVRRAAAGQALCRGGQPEFVALARKLLKDRDPSVRLKVALALADTRDPDAIPILVSLINDLPSEQSGQAEEYLTRVARDTAPKDLPDGDEGRKKRSDAWAAWWEANKGKVVLVDRSAPLTHERYFGNTLLIQANNNQIIDLGADHKQRWALTGLLNPWDAQVLPGNRVLVAEFQGQRVTERDLRGNILWEHKVPSWPMSVERMRNGNTFIACRNLLIEVDRSGHEVLKIERPHDIMSARKLPSGQIVCITNNRQVMRLDRTGRQLKSFAVANIFFNTNEILNNGNILVPLGWMNSVAEYDNDGKEVARFNVPQPNHAWRMPNGHTLIASQNFPLKLYEMDRKGKQISEIPITTYTLRVRRY
jgi:HEAT repeat protein